MAKNCGIEPTIAFMKGDQGFGVERIKHQQSLFCGLIEQLLEGGTFGCKKGLSISDGHGWFYTFIQSK